ncbi:ParB/RepB/Spo0J family partition protein [Paludisphaera rhizosphaerae]|uniref:ParB/RepB/Spo0J family partition protein n=1 Tax=Paludisphaera rhizosphaerae TaxID=2711216 RepID=UPI0013ED2033|nr:ParB/RepB/Spo0J family partition protein [Paludisphaera rhizosphaerae]
MTVRNETSPAMEPEEDRARPGPSADSASPSKSWAELIPTREIIYDPAQPRLSIGPEPLAALVESIRRHSILQPLLVRWDPALKKYVVIEGHRRLMAANELALEAVPAMIIDATEPADIHAKQVSANETKEGLTLSELAKAFQHQAELRPDATQAEIGASLSLNRSKTSFIQAYFVVEPPVRELVDQGLIPQMGLYYLARTNGEMQIELARAIAEGRMTVDACKAHVHAVVGKQARRPKGGRVTLKLAGATFTAESLEGLQQALDSLRRKLKNAGSLEELAALLKGA